jgi:protein-disulfide isomerase-like protein with CxxC motif
MPDDKTASINGEAPATPERGPAAETQTGDVRAASGARLNVNINARTADELRRVARKSGISYTEAVRRAVEVLAFIVDEREAGHAIQVYDPEKDRTRELITL